MLFKLCVALEAGCNGSGTGVQFDLRGSCFLWLWTDWRILGLVDVSFFCSCKFPLEFLLSPDNSVVWVLCAFYVLKRSKPTSRWRERLWKTTFFGGSFPLSSGLFGYSSSVCSWLRSSNGLPSSLTSVSSWCHGPRSQAVYATATADNGLLTDFLCILIEWKCDQIFQDAKSKISKTSVLLNIRSSPLMSASLVTVTTMSFS